jgi:hypothetical protein
LVVGGPERPGRRLATVAAAVLLFAGLGMVLANRDDETRRTRTTTAAASGSASTSTTAALPPPPYGWPKGTRVLGTDDPVVQAVLGLLPPGAELTEALDVAGASRADYLTVTAVVEGVEYTVAIHRRFDESELSDPVIVPEGKIWPGVGAPDQRYLYVLSNTGVGLYLSATGDLPPGSADALRALAWRIVDDPVLGQITTR